MNSVELISPVTGRVDKLENLADDVFANKMLGDGFTVELSDVFVTAPFDGVIEVLFPLGHAVCISNSEGISVMIHVGLDLYKEGNQYFKKLVKQGDKVKAGDRLIKVNLKRIKKNGKNPITPIIFLGKEVVKTNIENEYVSVGDNVYVEFATQNE